jgi:hypothetical protein
VSGPKVRATPAVSARFYFANEADEEAFKKIWVAD